MCPKKIPVKKASIVIKADLAKVVYERHGGISYREAKDVVELILGVIKGSLVVGENVKLSGFGSLNVVQRKGRLGRNPQTGERMKLAASKYVTFRPSGLHSF
ncbi:MAG: HU family DNA-binding protein [Acidobacteria bacterium]|nr:HU family DNA-binding protein [Acidobacteriota bacterium]MCZ6877218.1 HU family DNA-binding protein [Acidobacteriota bacterium]